MKKILLTGITVLLCVQTLAHTERRCRTRVNRYGERVTNCRDVNTRHHHRSTDNYSDGFFDGLLSSSLLLMTSDDGDYSKDFLESEVNLALATASVGEEVQVSETLRTLIDDIKGANEDQLRLTDLEALELISEATEKL